MKKWKCTVCGYIHTAAEPPDRCPVCNADKTKFIEISIEEAAKLEPTSPKPRTLKPPEPAGLKGFVYKQIGRHHIHPISVHFPNGVLPFTVIFLLLSIFFQYKQLGLAAFINLVGVTLSMPLVLFSGWIDWKSKYGGSFTKVFVIKMICGAIVTITGVVLIIWRIFSPGVTEAASGSSMSFFAGHLIMLGAAGIAGFIGGEIVFGTYGQSSKK